MINKSVPCRSRVRKALNDKLAKLVFFDTLEFDSERNGKVFQGVLNSIVSKMLADELQQGCTLIRYYVSRTNSRNRFMFTFAAGIKTTGENDPITF